MATPTHRKHLLLSAQSKGRFAGLRSVAVPPRQQAEEALLQGHEVVFDFAGLAVTQSFVDELIGALSSRTARTTRVPLSSSSLPIAAISVRAPGLTDGYTSCGRTRKRS